MGKILDYISNNFITLLVCLVIVIISFIFSDVYNGEKKFTSGIVVDKFHQPRVVMNNSSTTYSTKNTHYSQGTTTIHEKFILYVRLKTGQVVEVNSDSDTYYNSKLESEVPLFYTVGAYSGINYGFCIDRRKWE